MRYGLAAIAAAFLGWFLFYARTGTAHPHATGNAPASVYVLDSLTRQQLKQPPPPRQLGGAELFAAKGEVQAFQIAVYGGPAGLRAVDAQLTVALAGPGGATLTPTFYREHFITIGTPSNSGVGGARAGSYPDALIPFVNPFTGERLAGTYIAAPYDIAAAQNAVFYIEVPVPADAPAGVYRGAISVMSSGTVFTSVRVTVTVWNFAIPKAPSLHSAFHDYDSEHLLGPGQYYGYTEDSPEQNSLAVAMDENLLANRLVPEIPVYSYFNIDPNTGHIADSPELDAQIESILSRPERSDFKLHFESQSPFNDPLGADAAKATTYLRDASQWFNTRGVSSKVFLRPQDEPQSTKDFKTTQVFADFIHAADSTLNVAITGDFDQSGFDQYLFGHLNTFVMGFATFDPVKLAQRQAAGDQFWSYTAVVQNTPNPSAYWQIDFPLLNYRVAPWINYRYSLKGLLYWTTAYWKEIQARGNSVWTDACSVQTDTCFNGDGLLVYPGKEAGYIIPAGTYGALSTAPVYGPIPTLRLKAVRDGMQDYELLVLAAQKNSAAATRAAEEVGCRAKTAPGTVQANCFHEWTLDPDAFTDARRRLAAIILGQPAPGPR